jgi:hypothetical protein
LAIMQKVSTTRRTGRYYLHDHLREALSAGGNRQPVGIEVRFDTRSAVAPGIETHFDP